MSGKPRWITPSGYPTPEHPITIAEIQRAVAEHFRIPLIEMGSQRRARSVARPRQVAMFLCKELTPFSLPMIGRHFGGRDHTTVMHAVKTIEGLAAIDADLGERVAALRDGLRDGLRDPNQLVLSLAAD